MMVHCGRKQTLQVDLNVQWATYLEGHENKEKIL